MNIIASAGPFEDMESKDNDLGPFDNWPGGVCDACRNNGNG
jgi:hypothetical protein